MSSMKRQKSGGVKPAAQPKFYVSLSVSSTFVTMCRDEHTFSFAERTYGNERRQQPRWDYCCYCKEPCACSSEPTKLEEGQ